MKLSIEETRVLVQLMEITNVYAGVRTLQQNGYRFADVDRIEHCWGCDCLLDELPDHSLMGADHELRCVKERLAQFIAETGGYDEQTSA